jgi:hypothetical protein
MNAKSSKGAKSAIVSNIVSMIAESCEGREGFIKYKNGRWWECTASFAHQHVSAALRDCCPDMYSSSTNSKLNKRRRKIEAKKANPVEETQQCAVAEDLVSLLMSENEDDLSMPCVSSWMFDLDDDNSTIALPDLCTDLA